MHKGEKSIYLESAGTTLAVKGPLEIINDISKNPFLKEYIPNLIIVEKPEGFFELEINKGQMFKFETDKNAFARITGILNRDFSITDLITVIEYCFELIRQRTGVYCIHASASCHNGKAIILMGGASGIGKTKVNYLLTKNHNFTFISDEKTLIDKNLNVVGGLNKIIINKAILLKDGRIDSLKTEPNKNNIPIGYIYQPITTKNGELFLDEWDCKKANFHIYEELSRKIRGTSRRINNFTFPLESMDTQAISEKRSEISRTISEKIPCATIYGSPEKVAKFISEKVSLS